MNLFRLPPSALTVALLAVLGLKSDLSAQALKTKASDPLCPGLGWPEIFMSYTQPSAQFPTQDTAQLPTPDCNFHEWSWEAFAWAVAPVGGQPRFLSLPTLGDLLTTQAAGRSPGPRALRLGLRPHAITQSPEGAGAIVEADGNMLVGPNGYPVYASVHMNPSYLATAKSNLIINGGYLKNTNSYFSVGAGVFKATWYRVDNANQIPAGAYTTQATVPILATSYTTNKTATSTTINITVAPEPGKTTNVTVALVGLHVVGHTINHPEFLWGTFEHNLNCPESPDNSFQTSGSSKKNYTFYAANTSYSLVDLAAKPPKLTLNPVIQKFSPVVNVVQQNAWGGENQPFGVTNIIKLNTSAQSHLANATNATLKTFANYHLIGTVWMTNNTYLSHPNAGAQNAIGSVTLANSTAETFIQSATNQPLGTVLNCFTCHNYTSYNFQRPPPRKLPTRAIAPSHVLSVGTAYAVSNLVTGQVVIPAK